MKEQPLFPEYVRRVAAYVRVSSRSQDNATQREAISRAASARGDEITVWLEEKRSAAKLDRPELAKLRDMARRGEISKLYVFRLDRLCRSGIRDMLGILEELKEAGCQVISIADGFQLGGPGGDVVVAVMAWAAEMERLALGERISAARTRIEAKGGRWGRPARVSAAVAGTIRKASTEGKSIRAISVAYKIPKSTVATVLSGKGAYAMPKKRPKKRAQAKG